MRKILIPTDFSDNAWSATVYALKLYANEECRFYFLHSSKMKVSTMSNLSNKLLEILRENDLKELTELKQMAEAASGNANHDFKTILSAQGLEQAIDTTIKKEEINMVIMGTKGTTKAKEIFFGSNTVRTIKKMKLCPLLIVPDEFDFVLPKQIAFATNFERFYDDKELRPLKNMAALYNLKIRIICVQHEGKLSEIQNYNCTMLEKFLSKYECSFHFMPNYAKKAVEIKDFIEELNIDILAMVHYKHSLIASIINEPVIKKIGFHPIIPFLVIPE